MFISEIAQYAVDNGTIKKLFSAEYFQQIKMEIPLCV
jgi:hypothetical protein